MMSLEEAWLGRGEAKQILTGCMIIYVSDMDRRDVGLWGVWTSKFEVRGAGGVLTNLSNLRIAVVKELHQLEDNLVGEFIDLIAYICRGYLF